MSGNVVGLDPGLATFGLAAVDVGRSRCLEIDVFTSEPNERKRNYAVSDDRVRRARELARWLTGKLDAHDPVAVAAEAMSFPRGVNPVVCMSLAWGVIATLLEARRIPLVTALPLAWRRSLAPSGKEVDAHGVALVAFEGAVDEVRRVDAKLQAHGLDGLGVAAWSLSTDVVRAAIRGAQRR